MSRKGGAFRLISRDIQNRGLVLKSPDTLKIEGLTYNSGPKIGKVPKIEVFITWKRNVIGVNY